MSKYYSITFDRDNYFNDTALWEDIGKMIQILVKNEYAIALHCEDCGIYRLEYEYEIADMTVEE